MMEKTYMILGVHGVHDIIDGAGVGGGAGARNASSVFFGRRNFHDGGLFLFSGFGNGFVRRFPFLTGERVSDLEDVRDR
jgi:hypothetical protein